MDGKIIVIVLSIVLIVFGGFLWIYGIVKSFQSHPITGIIVLVVEPLPIVEGIAEVIFHYPLADKITELHQALLK